MGLAVGLTALCVLLGIVIARIDYYMCFSRPEPPSLSYTSDPWRPPSATPAFLPGLVIPSHGSSASSEVPPAYLESGYRATEPRRGLNYDYYHPPPGLDDTTPRRASGKGFPLYEMRVYTGKEGWEQLADGLPVPVQAYLKISSLLVAPRAPNRGTMEDSETGAMDVH